MTREHPRGNLPAILAPHATSSCRGSSGTLRSMRSRHLLCFGIVFRRSALHAVDRNLNGNQIIRLAGGFFVRKLVRRGEVMNSSQAFTPASPASRRVRRLIIGAAN